MTVLRPPRFGSGTRESLDSVLDGLEEWLYSEAVEEANLSVLKAKRQKVRRPSGPRGIVKPFVSRGGEPGV